MIAEYANGSLSKEYVYSGSQLLATIAGTTTTYHNRDHLSVRQNTNASGSGVGRQGHFPFGGELVLREHDDEVAVHQLRTGHRVGQ